MNTAKRSTGRSWYGALGMTVASALATLTAVGGLAGTVQAQQAVRQTDVQALKELEKRFAERFRVEHAAAVLWAQQQGIAKLRIEQTDGRIVQLMYMREGRPVYYMTNNVNAADSVSTDEIQVGGSSGLNLNGAGVGLHIWDSGSVRTTHRELAGRVTLAQVVGLSDHSTHVAGTMIASGVSAAAHGMANQATLTSYDFSNDSAEMAGQAGIAILSNHSYGTLTGWWFGDFGLGTGDDWHWLGNVNVSTVEDPNFGRYNTGASSWDQIAFNAPFYLIVKSAGNDRNDLGPSPGALHWHWAGVWVQSTDTHPKDGGTTGYDTVSTWGNAKNILTVGAVFDVIGGYSGPASVSMSSFSGWGPTDDGRIKPDLVGNGIALTSSISTNDSAYASFSGTSMSGPNVCGSLALWVQHYRNTHSGFNMRSATIKGLAIHTADESGAAPGPDYEFGWGLLNSLSAATLIDHDFANPEAIQELNLSQGQTISQIHTYNGVGPFKATICWTDPAAAGQPYVVDSTTSVLINDLDLRVIGPGGGTVFPWILNLASPASGATTGDNSVDNVEVVIINAPVAGDYTVQITHKATLTGGMQDFSLILSGVGSNLVPIGACCRSDGAVCSVETEPDCTGLGGDYRGNGTDCFDGDGDGIADACAALAVKFSQPPDGNGEDIPSNIDWTDMDPNVVVVDDFLSDGRPIDAVRWWGSDLAEVCEKPVPAGEDCWSTTCGSGTQVEFGSASIPQIPADFFGPGADPFVGTIEFQGRSFFDDTRIRRTQDMCLSGLPPVSDTVPIEIVKLDLISCAPITVTFALDPPEQYDVEVFLDGPQTQGLMTVTKNNPTGGTYDTNLPVRAGFRFTNVVTGFVRTLTADDIGPTLDLIGNGLPWVQDQPPVGLFCGNGGFFPGVAKDDVTCCPESCHTGPAPGHDHCVTPPKCPRCELPDPKACDLAGCLAPCGGDPSCGCTRLPDGTGACLDRAGPIFREVPCDVIPTLCQDAFGPEFKCFFEPCFEPLPFCALNCPTIPPGASQVEPGFTALDAAKAERPARNVDRSVLRITSAYETPVFGTGRTGAAASNAGPAADFQWDDGLAENAIGVGALTFGWANQFQNTTGGAITLADIEVAFGAPGGATGVAIGDAVDGVIWVDAGATGNMVNAVVATRWSLPGGVHANDGQTFATHVIPGGVVIPAGAEFYVGLGDIQTEIDSLERFPASIDLTTTNGKSWAFFGPPIFDPVNLAGQTIDLIDNFGFPGNWLIRANILHCAPPGDDCFTTTCGDPENPTRFDFALTPVPADFFFPGSPPFSGVVDFGGRSAFPGDTIVRRLDEMCFPSVPSVAGTIPIEIVQLKLTSCFPIDVGGLLFDVFVDLAPGPQALGTLTASKTHGAGGTYTADLPVNAQFTFQETSGGSILGPLLAPPVLLQTNPPGVWNQECCDTGCGASGFFAGWTTDPAGDPCCEPTCHPDPAGGHDHCVFPPDCPPCPPPPPICGDGVVNQPLEQCDRTDDAACPGECGPDCLCPIGGEGPDGWFVSFHEPCEAGALPAPPLALYYCDRDVVTRSVTTLGACDLHPVNEYLANLEDCCLVHANPDSRSGFIPAVKDAFLEEQCFEYGIDIQAVVGHEYIQDPDSLECIEIPTGSTIARHFWGWHTTDIERGRDLGLQQAFQSPVSMSGPDWLYGPWDPIVPLCSAPNMAFELLTATPGNSDANGNGIPDKCEFVPPDPPSDEPSPVEKNRYISMVPGNAGVLTALRVTLISSTDFPAVAAQSPHWWLTDPRAVCENSGQSTPPSGGCGNPGGGLLLEFMKATVECVSDANLGPEACFDWGSMGLIHATGEHIAPGPVYEVQAIECGQSPADPGNFSTPPLSIGTPKWCDLCGTGPGGACDGPPDAVTDVQDLVGILDKFKNNQFALIKARVDLSSINQDLNGVDCTIDVVETVNYLDAFGGTPFPFAGPFVCP